MAQSELYEHRIYLGDERRTRAYQAALDEVVKAGDTVLDLGCGTGILGYLAQRAGAASVVAVERGEIVALAKDVARANGMGDHVRHVQAMSTEVELDEPVDVVVCDQIGGLVHDAGILRYFADARRRLLAPGGTLVPASFRAFLAPVTYDEGRQSIEFWSSRPSGLDVSSARTFAANTEWRLRNVDGAARLSTGQELATFPADHDTPITGTASFDVDGTGRFDGFIGWFEAQLSPTVSLTNDPWSADKFDRWCNFYPIDPATDVAPGDRITARLDIRPKLDIVSWYATLERADGTVRRFRHSTYGGSFMTSSSIEDRAADVPVHDSTRAEVVREVLSLVDGTRTRADIVGMLMERVGRDFSTRADLEAFVRQTLGLLKHPAGRRPPPGDGARAE